MAARAPIIAGKSVIVVSVQDSVDKALMGISSKLKTFSNKVNRLGLELFSGGLFGSIGVAAVTKQFATFEDKILFLSTKLNATAGDLATVEARIRELGRTTSFTAQQVADGAVVLAQAGFNSVQVMDLLAPTLDLARGAQIDLASSGAILANTMRSFSLDTAKAGEVASQFIAASRSGTLNVLDLKESIKEVLGTVRALNIDLPTTLALITQLAERSLKGTKAGTSLNTALLNLASKGEQLKEMLGITLPDNLDGDSFIKFLDELYSKISKLGNRQQVTILQRLFNIRGGRAITALDDIKRISDLRKEIVKTADEARKAAVTMDSGLGGATRRTLSALESLGITAGKVFGQHLVPIFNAIPQYTAAVETLVNTNALLVAGMLAVPPAAVAIGAGLLGLSFIGAKLAGVLGGIALLFRGVGNALLKGINAPLIAATRLSLGFKRSLRGIDTGLSALFLTPEIQTRGRNAGKAKKSSFMKRVGKTSVPFIAPLEKGVKGTISTIKTVPPILMKGEKALKGFYTGVTSSVRPLLRYRTAVKNAQQSVGVYSQAVIAQKGVLRTTNVEIGASKKRLFEAQLAMDKYTKAIMANKQAQQNRSRDLAKLAKIDSDMASLINNPTQGKRTKAFKLAEKERFRQIAALGRARKVLVDRTSKAPTNALGALKFQKTVAEGVVEAERSKLDLLEKRKKSEVSVLNLQKSGLRNTNKGLTALKTARSKSVSGFFGGSGLSKLLSTKTLGSIFSGLGKAVLRVYNIVKKIDFVKILYNTFTTVGRLTKGFLTLANGVRRFVFSGTGILLILEALIIFGPKIEFINKAFTRMGTGIKNAFASIGSIFRELGPSFNLFVDGIKDLMAGRGDQGISSIFTSFSTGIEVIKSNFIIAWQEIRKAIAPALDAVTKMVQSTGALIGLMKDTLLPGIATAGSGLVKAFSIDKAGGGISDMIKSIIESIDLKTVFMSFGVIFLNVGKQLVSIFQGIYDVVIRAFIDIRLALTSMLASLPEFFFGNMKGVAGSLIPGTSDLVNQRNATVKIFEEMPNILDASFDKFIGKLDKIFSKDTAGDAADKIGAANAAVDAAQAEATAAQAAAAEARNKATRKIRPIPGENNQPLGLDIPMRANKLDLLLKRQAILAFRRQSLKDDLKDTLEAPKNLFDREQKFLDGIRIPKELGANAKELKTLREEIRNEQKAQRMGKFDRSFIPKRAQISDIVAATVGSYNSTRRNLLRVNPDISNEERQLEMLEAIAENTGGVKDGVDTLVKQDSGTFK